MTSPRHLGLATGTGDTQTGRAGSPTCTTIPAAPDETDDRPRCGVVGVYCEALGWLRREPGPANRCCRHFWAEAVSVDG